MKKTSRKQKFVLILLGIVLSFVCLEIILRAGGALFFLLQDQRNRASFSPDEFRVVCIGESTTVLGGENSFPAQLEGMLNDNPSGVKVKVINKGLVGKTSTEILRVLPEILDQYRPDLVVAMIGINDREQQRHGLAWFLGLESFLEHFRVYQFFEVLGMHIRARIKGDADDRETQAMLHQPADREDRYLQAVKMFASGEQVLKKLNDRMLIPEIPEEKAAKISKLIKKVRNRQSWILVEMARQANMDGRMEQAVKHLYQAVVYDQENYGAYTELGRTYQENKEYEKAIEVFQKAADLSPKSVLALMGLAECYDALGEKDQAALFYERVLNTRTSDTSLLDASIADWFSEHGDDEKADWAFREAIRENPFDYFLYYKAAAFYKRIGNDKMSRLLLQQGDTVRYQAEDYLPVTIHNYNEIIDLLAMRRIRVVCMQYPLRSIESLKKIFWTDYPILFVENKKNFEEALRTHAYTELFSDAFAGDFGHCRRKGNELIARNLAEVIRPVIHHELMTYDK